MEREKSIGDIVYTIFKLIGIGIWKYFRGVFKDIFNIFKDMFRGIVPTLVDTKNGNISFFKKYYMTLIVIICVLIFIVYCFIYKFLFFTVLGIVIGIIIDMFLFVDIDTDFEDWKYPYISVTLIVIIALIFPIFGGIVGYRMF